MKTHSEPKPSDDIPVVEPELEASAPEAASDDSLAAEVTKYKDLALRAAADLDNYRKRVVREKEDSIRYANSSLIESLVPIIDNFELGLTAAKSAGEGAANIVMGFEMVRKQLGDFLRDQGVEVIDAEGAEFDPKFHDAVAQEASADVPEGKIIRQMRKGYKLKDRLIRPASVVVSKGSDGK